MTQPAPTTWVDGVPATAVPSDDRGLHYGDGVFETMAWRDGRLRFVELHLARLARGLAALRIPQPGAALLRDELALACTPGDAVIKLIVTRGSSARGYAAPSLATSRRILFRQPCPVEPQAWWEEGVDVEWSAVTMGEQPALAGLKHLNRLEQVLARTALQRDSARPAQEALLCTSAGLVICGTMTNVFAVEGHTLLTPALGRAGVAGIMRSVILREAGRLGLRTAETELPRDRVAAARELLLCNARVGIWPVRSLGGRRLPVGSVTRQLQQHVGRLWQ
jgi:4-amino-4-deoxychorismate lyase